jgi:hypothetical protein
MKKLITICFEKKAEIKKYFSILTASIVFLNVLGIAKASFTISATIGGVPSVSGATLETFDETTPPSILTLVSNANGIGSASIFTGFVDTSQYCIADPPIFSGETAAFFGETSTPDGYDATPYVAVWHWGEAILTFPTPQQYLGLLWGSLDADNQLTFYDSANNSIGTIMGSDVSSVWGTYYVNIISTVPFTSVVATNEGASFEFDDVAYSTQVPEPATLLLLGLGGLTLLRKRRLVH